MGHFFSIPKEILAYSRFRILISFLQVLGSVNSVFRIEWGKNFNNLLLVSKIITLDVETISRNIFPCFLSQNTTYLGTFLMQLGMTPLMIITTYIAAVLVKRIFRKDRKPPLTITSIEELRQIHKFSHHIDEEDEILLWEIILFHVFLHYPNTCFRIFHLLICVKVTDEESYLVGDMNYVCSGSYYSYLQILAYILLVIYVLGLPMYYLRRINFAITDVKKKMKRLAEEMKEQEETDNEEKKEEEEDQIIKKKKKKRFKKSNQEINVKITCNTRRFLFSIHPNAFINWYKTYEEEYWGWETIEYFRKAIFCGVLAILSHGTSSQVLVGITLSILYLLSVVRFEPFENIVDDRFQTCVACLMIFIYMFALVIQLEMTSVAGREFDFKLIDRLLFISCLATMVLLIFGILSPYAIYYLVRGKILIIKGDRDNVKDNQIEEEKLRKEFEMILKNSPPRPVMQRHGRKKIFKLTNLLSILERTLGKETLSYNAARKNLIQYQNEEINIYKLKVHMRPILSSIISTTKRYQVDKALKLWSESLEKERRKFRKKAINNNNNRQKIDSNLQAPIHRNPMFKGSKNSQLKRIIPSPPKTPQVIQSPMPQQKKIYGAGRYKQHKDLVDMMMHSSIQKKQKKKNGSEKYIDVESLELEKVGKKFYYFDFKRGMIYDLNYHLVGEIRGDGEIHIKVGGKH
jgi:hypothetical protein